jgi:hypothetical protein
MSALVEDFQHDVRFSARLLRRNPLFIITAALSLAIGIGANTTIFTVANALLFRAPAGVLQPDRLVDIGRTSNGSGFNNERTASTHLGGCGFGMDSSRVTSPSASF